MVSWLLDDGTRVHDSIALMWRGAVGQEEGSSARLQVQPLLVRYQAVAMWHPQQAHRSSLMPTTFLPLDSAS